MKSGITNGISRNSKDLIFDGATRTMNHTGLGEIVDSGAFCDVVAKGWTVTSFIVSLNLHRGHLSESQRAMVADRITTMRQGERNDLTQIDGKLGQKEASDMLNVGQRTVQKARTVRTHGVPELAEAVQSGKVSLNAAEHIARLPPDEQKKAMQPKPKTNGTR